MTPSQFRQALETLAFTDGSRMAVQLASGQTISGRFQTMLTNGDMVWFTEERGAEERQWLIDVTQIAAVAEPWRDTAVPVSNDGRVEMWRGGCRLNISVSAPFVWRCLSGSTLTPFPHPAHRTGHADFPHPALGQDFTHLLLRATPSAVSELSELIGGPISMSFTT